MTGSAQGLGKAFAVRLLAAGAKYTHLKYVLQILVLSALGCANFYLYDRVYKYWLYLH